MIGPPKRPQISQSLDDFANHYNMSVVPARVAKPKDKSKVENQVKLLYTRVYAKLRNRQFFDIASLNEAIKEKVNEHNQTRMQRRDYCRQERFLAVEKPLLLPLPEQHFELKYYCEPKVADSGHVCIRNHFYSVPYTLTGTRVKVVYTRNMVNIYAQGKMVAVHIRSYSNGGYSSVKEHLSSQNQAYLNRSPTYYLKKARSKSEDLYLLVEQIFQQDRYPEQLYRSCDGLFRLHRDSNPDKFAKACQIAIHNGIYSYKFVQKILENNMADHQDEITQPQTLPAHHNIRGKDYYIQSTINFLKNEIGSPKRLNRNLKSCVCMVCAAAGRHCWKPEDIMNSVLQKASNSFCRQNTSSAVTIVLNGCRRTHSSATRLPSKN